MLSFRIFLLAALIQVITGIAPPAVLAELRIGVLAFSEEGRYREALAAIKEQLARAGYKEPAVTFIMGNAGGSKAKAAELVKQYATENLSLMITIGTTATVAAAREIKGIPIIFSQVYDPVEAGVAKSWNSSGTNLTGTSSMLDMSELVARLHEVRPAKRLAVIYTPGEKNTESQLKDLQAVQKRHDILVLPVILSKKEDIDRMLPEVMSTVDAVYLSGSSVIGANLSRIVTLASSKNVVSITSLEDFAEKGALLGVCGDPSEIGRLVGKKVIAVLKGTKPSSIPIEHSLKQNLIINAKTAKASRIAIPKQLLKKATKVIE